MPRWSEEDDEKEGHYNHVCVVTIYTMQGCSRAICPLYHSLSYPDIKQKRIPDFRTSYRPSDWVVYRWLYLPRKACGRRAMATATALSVFDLAFSLCNHRPCFLYRHRPAPFVANLNAIPRWNLTLRVQTHPSTAPSFAILRHRRSHHIAGEDLSCPA